MEICAVITEYILIRPIVVAHELRRYNREGDHNHWVVEGVDVKYIDGYIR